MRLLFKYPICLNLIQKNKSIPIFLLATVLSITSCTMTKQSYHSLPVVSKNVELDPIKADIQVDESKKLTGTATAEYFLSFWVKGDRAYADGITFSNDLNKSNISFENSTLNNVRSAAAYKALEGTGFDILVHPTYKMTIKNSIITSSYEVTVEGYGAKYVNFRTEKEKQYIITDKEKEYIFTK